jgi:PadR family transcriptional regulator PadR
MQTRDVRVKVHNEMLKGMLEMVVLQLLQATPLHGYGIISEIRKTFGVYFGPSIIYPLLNGLETKGCLTSEWDMSSEKPRKVYKLTTQGRSLLNLTEESFSLICRKIGIATEKREIIINA